MRDIEAFQESAKIDATLRGIKGEVLSDRKDHVVRPARLIPIVIAMMTAVVLLTGGGCGKGLYPVVSSSSATATSTTSATSNFLYATNNTDGILSAFARNVSTGVLTFIAQYTAGADSGPMGLAITPDNDFLYVVNSADNQVYEYEIGSTGALLALTNISGGTAPQMIAIDNTGSFAYVTNATTRSVSEYVIASNGELSLSGTITGFPGKPFGVITSGSFLYVTDETAGLIYAFAINSDGTLTILTSSPISSNGSVGGEPGLMAVIVQSGQDYLMVDDLATGEVAVFLINSDGSLTFNANFGTGQSNPVGIGAVTTSINSYVFTANMTGGFVQPYTLAAGILTQQNAASDPNTPTGLAIDPAGLFVYTGNSGTGTIAQLAINGSSCGGAVLCLVKTYEAEHPTNATAGTEFIAITH